MCRPSRPSWMVDNGYPPVSSLTTRESTQAHSSAPPAYAAGGRRPSLSRNHVESPACGPGFRGRFPFRSRPTSRRTRFCAAQWLLSPWGGSRVTIRRSPTSSVGGEGLWGLTAVRCLRRTSPLILRPGVRLATRPLKLDPGEEDPPNEVSRMAALNRYCGREQQLWTARQKPRPCLLHRRRDHLATGRSRRHHHHPACSDPVPVRTARA